jgi:hypothetical protein
VVGGEDVRVKVLQFGPFPDLVSEGRRFVEGEGNVEALVGAEQAELIAGVQVNLPQRDSLAGTVFGQGANEGSNHKG